MSHPPHTSWLDPDREVQQFTRRQTRPVTAPLIDDLRLALLSQEPFRKHFRCQPPKGQQSMIEFAIRVLQIPESEFIAAPDKQCDEATLRVAAAVSGTYANSPLPRAENTLRLFERHFQRDSNTFSQGDFSMAHKLFRDVVEDSGRWADLDAEAIISPLTIVNAFDVNAILSEISGPGVQPPLHRQATTSQQAFRVMADQFERKIQSARTLLRNAIDELGTSAGWVEKMVCDAENVQAELGQVHQRLEVVDNGTLDLQFGRENLIYIKERTETIFNSM